MTEYSWHLPDPVTQPEFYSDVPAKRLLAWVVDTVLIVLICLLIVPFTAFTGLFFFPFLLLVVGFAYRVVTIARGSATWGMRLVSLEFRKLDGQRFDLSMALLHTLGLTISFGFPILQVISIVLMLTTERGQGLSDHVLGTVALNRRATA
ncbi:RDD family protein [Roseovarius pacificus]|uniref:RDD family protein n=1 Tax=Roseovarius pacificus TaxID=337701 RepID=A0A1M7ENQ8_9RHOB|nr:RDD family protein [Roseovarius pacificus]GGO57650.1 RDD family protein [Roseovarius pacificus]SHL93337.1 RDD family protein [Roseovarius pacificus]